MASEEKQVDAISRYLETLPESARLDWYQLTPAQRAILRAMCNISPPDRARGIAAGHAVWRDMEDIGLRAQLSRKTVQRAVYGYIDRRTGVKQTGLKARGVLSQTSKAKPQYRIPATWRINWDAFIIEPSLMGELEQRMQQNLPGIKRLAAPGEDTPPSAKAQATGVTVTQVGQNPPLPPVNVTQDLGHRDAQHASLRPATCVTVTHRLLELSSDSSNELSTRSSSQDTREVKELRPPQEPEKTGEKAGSEKSAFQKLPSILQQRLTRELDKIRETKVGLSYSDDRAPQEIAGEQKHLVLVAAEKAGIWPHVAKQIAAETYQAVLADELRKRKGRFDA